MDNMEEKILLEKIRNDDVQAFRKLYEDYFQRLYLFSKKFLPEEQARDVVQDCFFRFWIDRKKIRIEVSVASYLFTMIKNQCVHSLKDTQRKHQKEQHYHLLLKTEELEFFNHSEKSILEFDIKDRIEKVFDELPRKCALIFRESRFEGLTYPEIATKYDISVKAVEKHINRALKAFREELKEFLMVFFLFPFKKNH